MITYINVLLLQFRFSNWYSNSLYQSFQRCYHSIAACFIYILSLCYIDNASCNKCNKSVGNMCYPSS